MCVSVKIYKDLRLRLELLQTCAWQNAKPANYSGGGKTARRA